MTPGSGDPLGRQGCERLVDAGLDAAAAGVDVEVVVETLQEGLTRFAGSQVHQNVSRHDIAVTARVVTGDGRAGVVTVHTDDPGGVATAVEQAAGFARLAPADADYPGLAPPQPTPDVSVDVATAGASPERRAGAVADVLAEVPAELEAAGAYRTAGTEMAVVTTAGQRAYSHTSAAALTLVVSGPSSSGYAEAGGRSMVEVDPGATAKTAVHKALAGRDPVDVAAGSWPVVLEAPAVATLMQFLAYLGFGGRDWLEGRAFTSGRIGEQLTDPAITLLDDALGPGATGRPFDHEGTPRSRVELLREGVAAAVVHDRRTAARAGTASTGHALRAPNTAGPMSLNPLLLPGEGGTVDDLVARCDRGLLVTRFHYTNVIDPKATTVTGMTRDGTFTIEGGRVTSAVRNLRFTQSILAALEHVDAVSSQTSYANEIFDQGAPFPALALPDFAFSGATTFG